MKTKLTVLALCTALVFGATAGATTLQTFPLQDVRLLSSPFKRAEQNNIDYLLALDPDKLLAPYREEAGIKTEVESYGNWEASGLGGHIGGHYLSALSMMVASTGEKELLDRLNYMIAELKKCQDKHTGGVMAGYIGGVPGGAAMWREIADGRIEADNFSLNDKWVPWYNLHKLYAGLRDAYLYTGNTEARAMLVKLGDWALNLVEDLSDEQVQQMLQAEHGGMNEVFADIAAITGEDKYLELARRFSHRAVLQPLLDEEDRLTGLHANTQIPKVIGFERVAGLSADERWHNAAEFFWETVINRRTVAIGGNSVREHFHPVDDFKPMITEPEGPETCNTYNMLRLSNSLYQRRGDLKYIDYYERALYNHILSSQHPGHGGLVYFTPMRPQHYRVYSQPEKAMWCCVGSGIENHSKYGELIYARDGGSDNPALYVNLFIPSVLDWRDKGITVRQETAFPDEANTRIRFDAVEAGNGKFTLNVRYPTWVKPGAMRVTVNDKPVDVEAGPGGYVTVERRWEAGDVVAVTAPMHTRLEPMPDGSDYYAVLHGPVVLAAKTDPFENEKLDFLADDSRMGHIPDGQMCPLEAAPVLVGDPDQFLAEIERIPDRPLTFVAPEEAIDTAGPAKTLKLIPFFRLHDSRYTVYWPASSRKKLDEFRRAGARAEQARLALEAVTIDSVAPGEQQSEVEHDFKGEGSESGVNMRHHWRHAHEWFSYVLKDGDRAAKILRIRYFGGDAGRAFDILINGHTIAEVELDSSHGAEFYTVDYPIPEAVLAKAPQGRLTVKFVAREDSIAGGIYGVSLLSGLPDGQK